MRWGLFPKMSHRIAKKFLVDWGSTFNVDVILIFFANLNFV